MAPTSHPPVASTSPPIFRYELFCPGQDSAGAFGVAAAQAIKEMGLPAGDLSDGLSHPSVLVSNFYIPATGNPALDTIADLQGPGSLSLFGDAQFFASPSERS